MHERLQNKFAVITGGSRSVAAVIVKRPAQEGAHVASTDHTSPDGAKQGTRGAGFITRAGLTIDGGFTA